MEEELSYSFKQLQERYKKVLAEKKKYDKESTTLYYKNEQLKKMIKELRNEIKDKNKQIKELKIINTALYEKIYSKGVN